VARLAMRKTGRGYGNPGQDAWMAALRQAPQ